MYPLTGCPQQQFFLDDVKEMEEFWLKILSSDDKNYPMCCSIFSEQDKGTNNKAVKSLGLVDHHAYTLIGAKEIFLDDGLTREQLVKIRNPHGRKEWTGDWGDKSKKWTPKTRDQVVAEDKDDGIFFICVKDFVKFFATMTICYYIDSNEDNCITD